MRMRVVEGQYGKIQALVLGAPGTRTCQTLVYAIKPLCMHQRLMQLPQQIPPVNELRITGTAMQLAKCSMHAASSQQRLQKDLQDASVSCLFHDL